MIPTSRRPARASTAPTAPTRRDALRLGAGALALLPAIARAQAPAAPPLGDGERFEAGRVVDLARALARKPYAAPALELPDAFAKLSYEQYVAIRAQPDALVWGGEGRGFVVEPLHRGFVFTAPVELNVVEDGRVRRLAYDRERYRFGADVRPPEAGRDLAFSGFRLYAAFDGGAPAEFAIAQGGTFLRVVGKGQTFGTTARALMLKPGEARGEEFPAFRAFWIERPGGQTGSPAGGAAGGAALTVHALIDSESATAAVRMVMRPGETSTVDVQGQLFARTALDHVGLAGMTGAYLFAANERRGQDDARSAAYEANGLQVLNGGGEALWRPLRNPDTLQISAFLDRDPRGFGLMQRQRAFAAFQDDVQHWERRPSLWIEPATGWGEGAVQLIEIPSESEINENVMAYWRPRAPVPAGGELGFAYRQAWCPRPPAQNPPGQNPPVQGPLAEVSGTRTGRGTGGRRRRFLVEFAGERLAGPTPDVKPVLWTSAGAIRDKRLYRDPDRRALRVAFELDPGSEGACEMRLVLEADGKPTSETWLYRWTA